MQRFKSRESHGFLDNANRYLFAATLDKWSIYRVNFPVAAESKSVFVRFEIHLAYECVVWRAVSSQESLLCAGIFCFSLE